MKIFLDSANIEEIKKVEELGLLGGITTNPTLIAKNIKSGEDQKKLLREICKITNVDILAEPISTEYEKIVEESIELAKISPEQIVAKIPLTEAGLKAVKKLLEKKIKTALTLIFSPLQALTAAIAGVDYICPFVGRLDDIGQNGMDLIRDIVTIYKNFSFKTKIIVASVRNTTHVLQSALYGADAITVPYKIIDEMLKHQLTDAGIKKFLDDWARVQKEVPK
ncbi:MAG: fructose-6-phosphate aldolase [Endomicrobiia bacterium]